MRQSFRDQDLAHIAARDKQAAAETTVVANGRPLFARVTSGTSNALKVCIAGRDQLTKAAGCRLGLLLLALASRPVTPFGRVKTGQPIGLAIDPHGIAINDNDATGDRAARPVLVQPLVELKGDCKGRRKRHCGPKGTPVSALRRDDQPAESIDGHAVNIS